MENGATLHLNFFIINVCLPINLTTYSGTCGQCSLETTNKQKVGNDLDLPQVDLMTFRAEYVRPGSGRLYPLLWQRSRRATAEVARDRPLSGRRTVNKPDEGHFRKSRNDLNLCDSKILSRFFSYGFLYMYS